MATTMTTDVAIAREDREFATRTPRSLWSDARRRLFRNKASVASMIFIALLTLIAIAAPLLAPRCWFELWTVSVIATEMTRRPEHRWQ